MFDVKHMRVQQDLNSKKRDNCFIGPEWEAFGNGVGLENGQRLVFTNFGNNRLSVVVIGGDGVGISREDIFPTMLKRNLRQIQFRDRNGNAIQYNDIH